VLLLWAQVELHRSGPKGTVPNKGEEGEEGEESVQWIRDSTYGERQNEH
jgi:hypothetical protein